MKNHSRPCTSLGALLVRSRSVQLTENILATPCRNNLQRISDYALVIKSHQLSQRLYLRILL